MVEYTWYCYKCKKFQKHHDKEGGWVQEETKDGLYEPPNPTLKVQWQCVGCKVITEKTFTPSGMPQYIDWNPIEHSDSE